MAPECEEKPGEGVAPCCTHPITSPAKDTSTRIDRNDIPFEKASESCIHFNKIDICVLEW